MKKLIFGLLALAVLFASCSNSAGGAAGAGLDSGTLPGGSDTNNGGTTSDIPVLVGASNLMYIGEGTETVDSTAYTVKKYADVMVDNPYFYTYYKLYYLNGKLRRVYQYEHVIGCAMDYKYTEFVEHYCYSNKIKIHTYHENGKLESYTLNSFANGSKNLATEAWYYSMANQNLVCNMLRHLVQAHHHSVRITNQVILNAIL